MSLTGTCGQTDTTKIIRNFCDYALVPKNLQRKEEEEEEEVYESFSDSESGKVFET